MEEPSVYLYFIFLALLILLIKNNYWKNIWGGILSQIKNNYLLTGIIVLINFAIVFLLDMKLIYFFRNNKNIFLESISKFGNFLGDGEVLFASLSVILVVSILFDFKKIKILFSISFMSAVYSGIAVNVLKLVFCRTRPFYNSNPLEFFQYLQAISESKFGDHVYLSMPSGHTITTFAFLIPFFLYFKNKFVRLVIILIAVTTAFARVYSNVHWPSDVFMGAVIGSLVALVIYANNQYRLENLEKSESAT